MPWNSTWPNGATSVRANQPTGQQNTTYVETTVKKDHYFNEDATKDGYHKKASMPTFGSTPSIPAGTDGVYYVLTNGSEKEARYTNAASTSYHLNIWTQQLRGSFTSGAVDANFTLVDGIPSSAVGEIIIFRRGASAPYLAMIAQFASDSVASPNNTVHGYSSPITLDSEAASAQTVFAPIVLLNDPSNKNRIRGFVSTHPSASTYAGKDFEYIVNYRVI